MLDIQKRILFLPPINGLKSGHAPNAAVYVVAHDFVSAEVRKKWFDYASGSDANIAGWRYQDRIADGEVAREKHIQGGGRGPHMRQC